MDLSSMLNSGPAPALRSETGSIQSDNGFHESRRQSQQPIPPYGPPSHNSSMVSSTQSLTPLQISTQTPAGGQVAYTPQSAHQHPQGSGAGAPGLIYHPPDLGSSSQLRITPPQFHNQPSVQRTSSSGLHMPVYSSLSPSSHPLPSHLYQQSQPSTPLGPPSLIQRSSTQYESVSPFHQRTLSGTANLNHRGTRSPAQQNLALGALVDSPGGYGRPSPRQQSVSENRSSVDRERTSVSVSPKTMIPTRVPSLGSRQSSVQEHSSAQSPSSIPAHGDNYTHASQNSTAFGATNARGPQGGSDVMHMNSIASLTATSTRGGTPSQPNDVSPIIQHSVQKMGMDHLLASTNQSAFRNGVAYEGTAYERRQSEQRPGTSSSTSGYAPDVGSIPHQATSGSPVYSAQVLVDEAAGLPTTHERNLLKRSAGSMSSNEPPHKRGRQRKYTQRPIWANLSPLNPRFKGEALPAPASAPASAPDNVRKMPPEQQQLQPEQQLRHKSQTTPQPALTQDNPHLNDRPQPPANSSSAAELPSVLPWRQDPPLDHDLLHARSILGQWEKTCKYTTPIPSMVRSVTDWFVFQLDTLESVGNDPMQGTIEIEAKIGTLIDNNNGLRCSLPVKCATLIDPNANKHFTFESQMNEAEHQKMNKFLNSVIYDSQQKGRVPLTYQHTREIDSFRSLSNAGLAALPSVCASRLLPGREPKLRTTTSEKTGQITARIVKVPLGHIHIYNPDHPYDARISINIEVNLHNRPDIPDPSMLGVEPASNRAPAPDRRKDRMSYKHLAYSIDLTRVDVKGSPDPKFELELEVNAGLLREQMDLMKKGQNNALSCIVEGFLDNATLLMRSGT